MQLKCTVTPSPLLLIAVLLPSCGGEEGGESTTAATFSSDASDAGDEGESGGTEGAEADAGEVETEAGDGGDGDGGDGDGGDGDGDGGDGDGDGDGDGGDGDGDGGDGDGDGGDGDGDGGDGDGDGGGDGGSCFEIDLDMGVVPPNILFLIDKSSSMTMTWSDGGMTVPRWNSLRAVVDTVTTQLDDHVNFGAKTYPKIDSGFGECGVDGGVDVGFALDNGATILATLPGDGASLQGNTPTQSGVEAAIAHLNAVYDADPSGTPPQAMVLVADGGIGCSESAAQTEAAIAAAFAQSPNSISTYVVGIDISAFVDDEMNAYAQAGGHPVGGSFDFYQSSNGDQLATAIEEVISDIQLCEVPLDPQPNESITIEVRVDGVLLDELGVCGSDPGYVIEDLDGVATLVFCGPSCDAVKATGTANVQYFCDAG